MDFDQCSNYFSYDRTPEEVYASKGVKPTLSPNLETLALVEVNELLVFITYKKLISLILFCFTQISLAIFINFNNFLSDAALDVMPFFKYMTIIYTAFSIIDNKS